MTTQREIVEAVDKAIRDTLGPDEHLTSWNLELSVSRTVGGVLHGAFLRLESPTVDLPVIPDPVRND